MARDGAPPPGAAGPRRGRQARGKAQARSVLPDVPAGFHYDRGRRLAMPGAPGAARPRGWLRGNRGLRILLLDVVIIGILVVVAARLIQGEAAADRVDEFALRAETQQRSGATILTLTVSNERIFGRSSQEQVVARVSGIGHSDGLAGGDAVRLAADLPRRPGESVTMRAMLWTPDEAAELLLRIAIRERVVALLVTVDAAGSLTVPGRRE